MSKLNQGGGTVHSHEKKAIPDAAPFNRRAHQREHEPATPSGSFLGALVYADGNQTFANTGVGHSLAFVAGPTVYNGYDTSNFWSASNDDRLTVPSDGYYESMVHLDGSWASLSGEALWSGGYLLQPAFVSAGGSAFRDSMTTVDNSNIGQFHMGTVFLSAGDYVEFTLVFQQGVAGNFTASTATTMEIHRLG